MYEAFFGFRERPFDLTPDPRYLVSTAVHREALSNLEYAIGSRKGISLLLGEAGTGKTTVIRAAIAKQPEKIHCVHLHNPALNRNEFVEMLSARFDLSQRARTSKSGLLLELEELLRSRSAANETTVLIVDEAQSLPLELLEEIRLLTNIETNAEKLLTLIIAGQPELATRFTEHSLRQLKQRIALRCELRPLSLSETAEYIAGRINVAGGYASGHFYARGSLAHPPTVARYSANDQRNCRQRAGERFCGAAAARHDAAGARSVSRLRYRRRTSRQSGSAAVQASESCAPDGVGTSHSGRRRRRCIAHREIVAMGGASTRCGWTEEVVMRAGCYEPD